MKKIAVCLLVLPAWFATTVCAGGFEGPLVIKNGHPLYAALNSPALTSAEPENSLNINFSYSSTFFVEENKDWRFGIDLETAILGIQLKRLAGKGTEVGFDIPVIRYGSGFMDDVIDTYHRDIGLANAYGRNTRLRNDFFLEVMHNGKEVIHGVPSRTALGDIMIEIKKSLYQTEAAHVSVQAFLNLPTGDPDNAYGSGRTNGGFAVLLNEGFGENLMIYLNAGAGFMDKLKAMQDVDLRNYYYGGFGLEWRYSPEILLNAQVTTQTSPFPKTGIGGMDSASVLGSLGGRYKLDEKSSAGFAVIEDLNIAGAPDIMVEFEYRYAF